ncbi:MAG: ComEC/Rec2 family competence protein [Acidimicrobiaceae bacterium]|nr:ComEC/Rec2 family competence protein [Acidimicrobiaceae bacterium]MYG55896.1 ComEC/Rec2 family competence protein [Acidimicrobiaceae bacterium]MYJ99502.1 ComEC/Rec2 family competence protein [Acidimicrobiaceae bacterium]
MTAHLVAMAAALGAWWMLAVSVPVLVVMALVTCWQRHIALVVLLTFTAVGTRGAAAVDALDPPEAGSFSGWVTLLDDPRPVGTVGVVATVRHERKRLTAVAHGATAARLDDALAGERLLLSGRIAPVDPQDAFAHWRHIVGRLTVGSVEGREPGSPVSRFANTVRRTLVDGAGTLSRSDRAIFLGMVIGDDRGQTAVVADDFRAAGLGHLLVVSGQNVAFVLAVVAPLAGRFRPAFRALWLFAALLLFAVITRFEPSVLRAVAMAGAGIGASVMGTPIDGKRALSWAVAGLLLIDPFLVHLVAFQLSVAATAGIVWWSARLADRFAGPAWLRVPMATTATAQLAVSPVLLGLFGPLPLASLPANLLAGPISGAVMVWGCTGGLLAGVIGGIAAEIIHLPSKVMLWWIGSVASRAALGPQATLGAVSIVLLGGAALLAMSKVRLMTLVAGVIALLVALVALVSAPTLGAGEHRLTGESRAIVSDNGNLVLVLDNPPTRALVESLRVAGGGKPKLAIALDGDRSDAEAVLALTERFGEFPVAAPPMHRVPGGRTVQAGQTVDIDELTLRFERVEPRLEMSVRRGVGS